MCSLVFAGKIEALQVVGNNWCKEWFHLCRKDGSGQSHVAWRQPLRQVVPQHYLIFAIVANFLSRWNDITLIGFGYNKDFLLTTNFSVWSTLSTNILHSNLVSYSFEYTILVNFSFCFLSFHVLKYFSTCAMSISFLPKSVSRE